MAWVGNDVIKSMADFDPNQQVSQPYATFSPYGKGFMQHRTRGGAITRYGNEHASALYRFDPQDPSGPWVEVCRKVPGADEYCDMCNQSTWLSRAAVMAQHNHVPWWMLKHPEAGRGVPDDLFITGRYSFRRKNGKLIHPLEQKFLCEQCRPLWNT